MKQSQTARDDSGCLALLRFSKTACLVLELYKQAPVSLNFSAIRQCSRLLLILISLTNICTDT